MFRFISHPGVLTGLALAASLLFMMWRRGGFGRGDRRMRGGRRGGRGMRQVMRAGRMAGRMGRRRRF